MPHALVMEISLQLTETLVVKHRSSLFSICSDDGADDGGDDGADVPDEFEAQQGRRVASLNPVSHTVEQGPHSV